VKKLRLPTPLLDNEARLRSLFPLYVPWLRESSGQKQQTTNEQSQEKKSEQEPREKEMKIGRRRAEKREIKRKRGKGQERERGLSWKSVWPPLFPRTFPKHAASS